MEGAHPVVWKRDAHKPLGGALPFEGVAPMALRTTVLQNDTEAFWLRLHTAEPPIFKLVQQHPGLKLADLDVQLGEAELKSSRFYKEVMVPDGWRHSVVFQNTAAGVICAMWQRGKGAAAEHIRPGAMGELPEDVSRSAKDLMDRFLTAYHTKSLKRVRFEVEIPHPTGLPVSARAVVIAPKRRPVQPHVRIEPSDFQWCTLVGPHGFPVGLTG